MLAKAPTISATAAALALLGVPTDPRPILERRLQAQQPLVAQLRTAAQLASSMAGLSAGTRARIERLTEEGTVSLKAGRDGDASRSFYRAIAAGLGREWGPRDEYGRALALRALPTVCDLEGPLVVELGQLYNVDYTAAGLLGARAGLRRAGDGETSLDLGPFDGIAPDLVHWPWAFAVPTLDLEEGSYRVWVEVMEGGEPLRRVEAPLRLVRGLRQARNAVERRIASLDAREDALASVRYPFDLAQRVNLGRVRAGDYDFGGAIGESMALLARLEAGEDLPRGGVGDLKRHYLLAEAGEILPYRLIVPEAYDGSRDWPLIVALHGRGGDEDTMAMRASGVMRSLARRHEYIVASPNGFRPDGAYGGVTAELPFGGPVRVRSSVFSERDVMEVLERVLAEYRIERDRVYLVGHSGGGGGAWRLASKYPQRWAAIAPIATLNTLEIDELERMRHIPVHLSHGDADPVAPLERARTMVERMRSLGMTYEYVEIPGGTHDLVDESLAGVFQFFDRHRRTRDERR